ncbi:MAG TPA: NAD(P)H-binding protein [Solirubrobacterales bacterium]
MEVAVMGASGNVGGELVGLLAAQGHSARALVRDPASAPPAASAAVAVDMTDGASLREALDGVDGAFMMSGYDDAGLVAELECAGVRRVALLSGARSRRRGPPTPWPLINARPSRPSPTPISRPPSCGPTAS